MTAKRLKILVAESEDFTYNGIQAALADSGHQITGVNSEEGLLNQLQSASFDLVLLDHDPPGLNSLEILQQMTAQGLNVATILVVDQDQQKVAVEALQLGMQAYLFKDPQQRYLRRLSIVIGYAYQQWQEKQAHRRIEKELRQRLILEEALAQISRLLISAGDEAFHQILQILGEVLRAGRGYIFLFQEAGDHVKYFHEWCSVTAKPKVIYRQFLDTTKYRWGMRELKSGLKSKEFIHLPNIDTLPQKAGAEKHLLRSLAIGSLIFVSIKAQEHGIFGGLAFADTNKDRLWSEANLQLLELASEIITNHFVHQYTAEAVQQHAAQLALINEIGRQIATVRELDQVLDRAASLLQETFGYHHVALFLLEGEIAKLRAIAGLYKTTFPPHHTQKLTEGIIGWVATHGEMLVSNDVSTEPHFISLIGDQTVTQSELCLPIKIADQTLGILDIQSTELYAFNENAIIAMETLVDAIAVAIESARLYEALQQELSERKQAERTLQNAYQRITLYIENSPLIVVEWDNRFRVSHWSQEAEEYFGWKAEQVTGKHPSEWNFMHKEDAPIINDLITRLLNKEERGNVGLHRNYTNEGKVVHCEWYNSAIFDEFDNLVSILSLVLDVTERRRAVSSLRESEQRFRQVISSISDHVYMGETSPDGKSVVTRYTSPNVEDLTGYPVERFSDWSFWQTLIHPDDLPVALSQLPENSAVEYRMRHANGSMIWVRDSRQYEAEWDEANQTERDFVYGVVHDITQRKLAEMALVEERALLAQRVEERTAELSAANAALAKAARLKDEFLANMSHELRTPLNAILGKSETLQEGIYGQLNQKQLRSLRAIEESGRHLLTLINEILDISKIEAGKLELEIRSISVKWICETSLRLVQEMALKKNVSLESTLDQAVTTVRADGRRLKQILVNLLSNAVKFTPRGGKIGLEVRGDVENEAVHFTVWDTGIGISDKDIGRLFQPFVQLDSSLARQFVGTGLGLSLVHRMTKLQGGGISVESEPDKGSRFTVSFPWPQTNDQTNREAAATVTQSASQIIAGAAAPDRQTSQDKSTNHRHQSEKPLILVVEDNEYYIETLLDYLPHRGYRVTAARDGTEAIELAREKKPDLILMDIQTPGMDGLEATRYIRQNLSLTTTPIIALTGLAMPGDRERCLMAGINEYLSKPVSLKKLVQVIEAYLP